MRIVRIVLLHIVQRARTRCTRAPGLSRAPRRRTRLSNTCVEMRTRTDRPAGWLFKELDRRATTETDARFVVVYLPKISILRARLYPNPLWVLLFSPEPKGVTGSAAANRR